MSEKKEIYWHLPGFCVFFYLNQVLLHLMKEYPDKFMEGYRIGSAYGTFPGAIWNGGRAVFGSMTRSDMERILRTYHKLGVPVRFTWTNALLTKEHTLDTYCNLIMELADNGQNQVLVNTQVLEEYLRERYPHFGYISSTTKRLLSVDAVQRELAQDYILVVLDYDLNHDNEVLSALSAQAARIELLADEICFPNCKRRADHYREESLRQLTFDQGTPYPCPNKTTKPSFTECQKRPAFLSRTDIAGYTDTWGYCNYKLVGRGLPKELVLESYLYYLAKEEEREFLRRKFSEELAKFGGKHNR